MYIRIQKILAMLDERRTTDAHPYCIPNPYILVQNKRHVGFVTYVKPCIDDSAALAIGASLQR